MGKKVANLSTTTLSGEKWKLHDQSGKVVILDFWASWCRPCLQSMPMMKKLYQKYQNNPAVILAGVSLDHSKADLQKAVQRLGLQWVQLYDENPAKNSFKKAFQVRSIPSLWILDKDGIVRGVDLQISEHDKLITIINQALKG